MKPRYCSIDVFKMVCLYGGFKSTSTRRMGDWPLFNEEVPFVKTQCGKITPDIIEEASKCWNDGVSGVLIAEDLGVSYSALHKVIAKDRDKFPYRRNVKSSKNG